MLKVVVGEVVVAHVAVWLGALVGGDAVVPVSVGGGVAAASGVVQRLRSGGTTRGSRVRNTTGTSPALRPPPGTCTTGTAWR